MNPTCDQIDARLTAWLLGELDEPAAAEVRTHVEACPRCRAAAAAIGPTLELLREGLSADAALPRRLSPTRRAAILASRRRLRFPVSRILQVAALLMVGFVLVGMLLPATQQARERARRVDAAAEMQVVNCEVQEIAEDLTVLHDVGGIVGESGEGVAADRLEERATTPLAGSDQSDGADLSDRNSGNLFAYYDRANRPGDGNGSVGLGGGGEAVDTPTSGEKAAPAGDEIVRLGEAMLAQRSDAPSTYGLDDTYYKSGTPALQSSSGPRPRGDRSGPNPLPEGVPAGRSGSSVSTESGLASFDSSLAAGAPSPVTAPADGRALAESALGLSPAVAPSADEPMELERETGSLQPEPLVLKGLYASRSAGGRVSALAKHDASLLKSSKSAGSPPAATADKELAAGGVAHAYTDNRDGQSMAWSMPVSGSTAPDAPAAESPAFASSVNGPVALFGNISGAAKPSGSAALRDEVPADWSETTTEGETLGRLETKAKASETAARERKDSGLASVVSAKPEPTPVPLPAALAPTRPKPQAAAPNAEEARKKLLATDSIPAPPAVLASSTATSFKRDEDSKRAPVFRAYGVNPFVVVSKNAFSTFSIDVDTASYTLARNYMLKGRLPPPEAVRTEEFVNFFDYAYKAPVNRAFAVHVEAAPSAFGRGLHLLKIGVKGRPAGREENRHANLVFLVDTSGSMSTPDRIGLIKESLRLLVDRLGPDDRVTIVQYDSHARLVIENVPAADKARILRALSGLQPSGSTNLEEGMRLAYEVAARRFAPGAVNRVLILSDGAANLGDVAAEDLLRQVERYRKQGVYCSVYGFGMGTYNDEMLETLANKGDGTYAFIDSIDEARRVFVEELSATMNTIASDVKIQVEFSPARVKAFRQLGYENRALRKEDFRNDQIDAGEVGSGQSATALYELELQGSAREAIGVVRVRYRDLASGKIEEIAEPVSADCLKPSFDSADVRLRLAACVAEFAEILRGSPFAEGSEFRDVAAALRPVALELSIDGRVQELLRLVQNAGGLSRGE